MDAFYGVAFVVGVLVSGWLVGGFAVGAWKERQAQRERERLQIVRQTSEDPEALRERIRADVARFKQRRSS